MSQTKIITVKIPNALKKEMKQVDVNWSEYIRECVQIKIGEQKMKEASAKLDEIRMRAKPISEDELLTWIQEGRER
jgi:hypothetical protein